MWIRSRTHRGRPAQIKRIAQDTDAFTTGRSTAALWIFTKNAENSRSDTRGGISLPKSVSHLWVWTSTAIAGLVVSEVQSRPLSSFQELLLSVGRFWAVFAPVMVIADVGGDGFDSGVEEGGAKGEPSDVLKDVRMLHGLRR